MMIEQDIRALPGTVALPDGIRLECHGSFQSPPKPLTPPVESLLQHFAACGEQLGLPIAWEATGGACDGNRLAAAGLPVVDSLGVRGGNIHTDQEFVQLDSLAERAKLSALFLMRLAAGAIPLDTIHSRAPAEVTTS
jgi:glutamate carboxypeptidase